MFRKEQTYLFKGVKFTDGASGPSGHGDVFWKIYHEFNMLSHKEQQKLVVPEKEEKKNE